MATTTKCNDVQKLIDHIKTKYPKAKESHPSAIQTKFDFPDKLVVNIFTTTGTVNFQGNSHQNLKVQEIKDAIEAINLLAV